MEKHIKKASVHWEDSKCLHSVQVRAMCYGVYKTRVPCKCCSSFSVLQKKQFPVKRYFDTIMIGKVCISRDMIKLFSGKGDMVAWLKKGEAGDKTSIGG